MNSAPRRVRTLAPAKINWTLEVLRRREDGYHEIRSVMQTIDLCDELQVSSAPELLERTKLPTDLPPGTLVARRSPHDFNYAADELDPTGGVLGESVIRVTQMLDPEWRRDVRASLTKKIPIAAGLGGGSSDAAAALRGLNTLWSLEAGRARLEQICIQIGSDVVFFLSGGTALVEGRGERVTSLPDVPSAWLVVVRPPLSVPEKTKRMYEALKDEDLTDGQRTSELVMRLKAGEPVRDQDMYNAFDSIAERVFPAVENYRRALRDAGAQAIHLCGAGPSMFSPATGEEEARGLAGRVKAENARVFVARTLSAREATRVVSE